MGLDIDLHHHEVGTAGQGEIGAKFNTLVQKGDEVQIYKYCVHNVAHAYGKTATFMPKPLVGDNGNGMHCHQSVWKDGTNLFAGDGYGNLSQEALYYIGGIIKHSRAINAFANASTNSYKRLVPGFEAPLLLVYSALNRSASIRIPYVQGGSPNGIRIEVRYGDCTANPYLMFASMLMAGLDGIKNKIEPVGPLDKDLYDLPAEEIKDLPSVCSSLEQALDELDQDRDFLRQGDVFTDGMIDGYIELKREEVEMLNMSTHPIEFEMYYSV
ncbi:MAG: glutamine synthetase, partial [Gammaproteobacteria bacterium]|nr:glutamine synthetase [Gammaproteobacteria bacterium]